MSKICPTPWRRVNHQKGYTRANSGQYIATGYDVCTKAMHKSQLPTMCGAEQLGFKCLKSSVSEPVLYPTQIKNVEDNNETVVTSNTSQHEICAPSIHMGHPKIPSTHAVADTGATSVLVMAVTPMKNVQIATNPLNINLPDGKMLHSTCICDVKIPGLPHVLKGHIAPALNVASLISI